MEVNGNPRIIETDDPTKISSYIHYNSIPFEITIIIAIID